MPERQVSRSNKDVAVSAGSSKKLKFPNIPLCRTIAMLNFFGGRLRVRDSECWLYKKNELKNIYKIEKSQIYKKKWNFRIFRYIEQSLSRTFLAVAWELEIANVDCIRKMNWKIYIRSKSHKYIKKNEISEYSAISNNRYLELFWRSPES